MQKRLAVLLLFISLFLFAACCNTAPKSMPASTATPTPLGATLFYSTYDNASSQETITALDGSNGMPLWKYTTSATDAIAPTLGDGVAYVATSASLIALDA